MTTHIATFRKYTLFALSLLILAGATGSFLRFGLAYGMPAGWGEIRNIVHAHSHTMFGWTVLALMALIWRRLPDYTGRPLPKAVRWQMIATFIFSIAQLAAFWPNGYGVTRIGSAEMPLGAIAAGMAGLTWFWFMALYRQTVKGMKQPPLPVRLWNWAVILMFIASLGAMSEPALLALHIENNFIKHLFLHLFLDLFTSGWLLLATMGALIAHLEDKNSLPDQLPVNALALFIIPTFLLGMSPDMLSPALFWVAALANLAAAAIVALYLRHFFQRWNDLPLLVKFGLLGLATQVGSALLMLIPGVWAWGAGTLRIFYLHDMLLVWTSSTLLGLLMATFGRKDCRGRKVIAWLWIIGVGAMWLALLLGGFVRWLPLSGRGLLADAAWASVAIVLAAILAVKAFYPSKTGDGQSL